MNLIGPQYLTTRTHNNIFCQLKIQWFSEDKIEILPDNIIVNPGSTTIYNNAADSIGINGILHIYGRDLDNNIYYKKIRIQREETTEAYMVNNTTIATPFKVTEGVFIVRKVMMDGINYYILEDKGVYMLLNADEFNAYSNTTYHSSVYEFNTVFPLRSTTYTQLVYMTEDRHPITISTIANLKLKTSNDVIWNSEGANIIAALPDPTITVVQDPEYIEYINGVQMTTGSVSISYMLAAETPHQGTIPESGGGSFSPSIQLPSHTMTAGVSLPQKISGIKPNAEAYEEYGFNSDIFKYEWVLEGTPPSWFNSCKKIWVTLASSVEDPVDTKGIAGLALGVDGNVPTVPALSANISGFMPEYRLFNSQFITKKTLSSQNEDKTGSWTIVKKYASSEYTVRDPGPKKDNVSVIIDDQGQYMVKTKPKDPHEEKGTVVAIATYNKSNPEKSIVDYTVGNVDDYIPKSGTDKSGNKFIEKIVGRVLESGTRTKVYQEHVGIIYFDFREGGDTYEGQFKISSTSTPGSYSVSGGRVRIINRSVSVSSLTITPTGASSIFIHATMNNGSASAKIDIDSKMPNETDTDSYYLIGTIDAKGKVIQDHHGGTPLFLFFSTDCVDAEDTTE